MPDDDRFPRKYGRGWGPAVKPIRESATTEATRGTGTPGEARGQQESAPLSQAVIQTIQTIPPGSLDFNSLAAEVQRIAHLVEQSDHADLDLCGLFGTLADDESVRLLAQVARLLVATMSGDLLSMSINEITWLLAGSFLKAVARRAGTDRIIPFTLRPGDSAPDALASIRHLLEHPSVEELIPILLSEQLPTSGGRSGVA
jgi:hypothetical protein